MVDADGNRFRILHVDDNEGCLKTFSLLFRRWFEVFSAPSGRGALEMLRKIRFDAVITDYSMPDLNGLQLLDIIRKQFSSIPVIFFTAQENEDVAKAAYELGASHFFVKEVGGKGYIERLADAIDGVIKQKAA